MDIVVIGAGIVGMAAAWRLASDGHAVTVIDREPEAGRGASYANGGQLSYSYLAPLADPAILPQLPRLLLDPDSPVRFRPTLDPIQYRWLIAFLAACRRSRSLETIATLSEIALRSRRVLHETPAIRNAHFNWSRTGKLVVYGSGNALDAAAELARVQATHGIERRVLDRDESLAIEPALAGIATRIAGGVFSPHDEAGDALLLTRVLEGLLRDMPRTRIVFGADVVAIETRNGGTPRLETSAGRFEAEAVVIAAGTGSRALGRMAGLDLPVYPIKGYSATAPVRDAAAAPRVSVTDAARKVVYARLGDEMRLAGIADIAGADTRIDRSRAKKLVEDAAHDLPDAADWRSARLWAGLRPATPTGVPLIGRTSVKGLFVDTGHGSLGFTLALGSAEMLAEELGRAVG